jgi:hypothetical protein
MPKCNHRVPHRCRLCDELIPAGQTCYRWVSWLHWAGWSQPKPVSYHAHPECYRLTAKWTSGDWECCHPGDMKRPPRQD